ncbi:DUF4192 domain-containing protein [Saccharothrix luteola]|uniref:DUF4192 domain-containing protein n=1 Tax=Saccharothrix luteola TaxID=2893018 RepID=UPI001E2DAD5B|nr:DUF4192 domain-containing protein [Saccharothrix luteola]MCC8245018.1 DUF4192 domain-containing protein [Saccharothrix luteola]
MRITGPADATADDHEEHDALTSTSSCHAIADFYDEHGTQPRWLGSVQGDADPASLRAIDSGRRLLEATDPHSFTTATAALVDAWADRDDGLRYPPSDGWPWPWQDLRHADWVYTFDGQRVWVVTDRATVGTITPTVLLPDPQDVLARRVELLDDLHRRTDPTAEDRPAAPGQPSPRRSRFDLLHEHVLRAGDRTQPLTDREVADLAFALTNPLVRDACLSFAAGEHADRAEALWTELVRASPTPERAEPAALLAAFAYSRRDLDLTAAAVGHAKRSCPGHRLAELLGTALRNGVPAEALPELARQGRELISQL